MSTTTTSSRPQPGAGLHRSAPDMIGPALVLVSALCFGAMAIFAKLADAAGVSTETLLLYRFSVAAVMLWLILAVCPDLRRQRAIAGRRAADRSAGEPHS